ncbi:serine carboxypeptidase II-3 [Gossypium australe]|uniref:Serine carboxypeptidase II-3 n=1 Tax=Gossypium australe TaxID=47621 RepID=A0A5B6WUR9_9ROSI|nr:serine carboxypeptidase II-3 [Gossypium australe]
MYTGLALNCDYSTLNLSSKVSLGFVDKANDAAGNMYASDIYAPLCNSSSTSTYLICQVSAFHSCSKNYIHSYLNNPEVQQALHSNVSALPYPWQSCRHWPTSLSILYGKVNRHWKDKTLTVLPIIKEVMDSGIRVWIYNGDTDGALPLSCSKYAINKLGMPIKSAIKVGGYAVGYQNLTFVTVRGAGHSIPSYQQAWALVLFSSFLNGKLPPSARGFDR